MLLKLYFHNAAVLDGFSVKGASCVLYRTRELRMRQYFAYSDWPGGLFVSPSMLGTRAGGPIASAWATMKHLGVNGWVGGVGCLPACMRACVCEFVRA
jgi:hypothetical protein